MAVEEAADGVVSTDSITEARERFAGAATRYDGDYDGWEAAVTT